MLISLATIFANNAHVTKSVAIHSNRNGVQYSETVEIAGTFKFGINTTKIHNSECIESPEILLNNLNWVLRLCLVNHNIDMTLSALPHNNVSYWSCELDTTVTLLGNKPGVDPHVVTWTELEYSNSNNSRVGTLIDYTPFHFQYTKDDIATFELELSTTPLDIVPPTGPPSLIQTHSKLYIKLNNVTTLHQTFSPIKIVQGVSWRVRFERTNSDYLYARLSADRNDFDALSTYKVFGVLRLLSHGNYTDIEKEFTFVCGRDIEEDEHVEYLLNLRDERLKDIYVRYDSANTVVEFKVHKIKEPSSLIEKLKKRNEHTHQKPKNNKNTISGGRADIDQ